MTALAATIHDPGARLIPAIGRSARLLRNAFAGIAINASDATPTTVLDAARDHLNAKVMTHRQGESIIGRARRDSVRLALEFPGPTVLYSDFCHVVRWIEKDDSELRATLMTQPDVDFLVVGRSPRAFSEEPERLRETERWVSHIYTLITGRAWDLMFAVRRFSRLAAEEIVRNSVVDTLANDVEWPLLAERRGLSLGYATADALYYRTMDDFDAAADQHDADALEWIRRLEFAALHATAMRPFLSDRKRVQPNPG